MRFWGVFRWAIALGIIVVSFANASWIATPAPGSLELIAAGTSRGPEPGARCDMMTVFRTVDRMLLDRADRVLVSVRRAGDGFRITLPGFPPCIEDARAAPSPERFVRQFPARRFVFDVGADDRAYVALSEGFEAAGQHLGAPQALLASDDVAAHARAASPGIWAFNLDTASACHADYMWRGWTGLVPASCKDRTALVPLDAQWSTWGWPNRFASRMAGAEVRTILTGPGKSGGIGVVDQIPKIPRDYKAALWVQDISAIGPALRE